MRIGTETHDRSLERWSARLFLVGGVLLLGHASMVALETFGSVAPPPDVFAPAGHLLGVLGLLGLVAGFGRRWRWGLGAVALPTLAGWVVVTSTQFAKLVGLAPGERLLPVALAIGLVVLTTLSYVSVALATSRVGEYGARVRLLVAAPAVLLVALMGNGVVLGASPVGTLLVATGLALAQLGLGAVLRHRAPTGRGAPAAGTVRG